MIHTGQVSGVAPPLLPSGKCLQNATRHAGECILMVRAVPIRANSRSIDTPPARSLEHRRLPVFSGICPSSGSLTKVWEGFTRAGVLLTAVAAAARSGSCLQCVQKCRSQTVSSNSLVCSIGESQLLHVKWKHRLQA